MNIDRIMCLQLLMENKAVHVTTDLSMTATRVRGTCKGSVIRVALLAFNASNYSVIYVFTLHYCRVD